MNESEWSQIRKRLPEGVNLLAVSKGHPISSIETLAAVGQQDFGESRIQEALPKVVSLGLTHNLRWHFIGRLQSNKIRKIVKNFDVIHSLASIELAEKISRIALEERKCPDVMLQVKLHEDPSKCGFTKDQLLVAWPELVEFKNFRLIGLMTMAPLKLEMEERRNIFRECRVLADSLHLPDCSMGMSADWQEAVEAGATWLRIGSKLFGARNNAMNSEN